MSVSGGKLRSLSHKVLSPPECKQLKIAIQSFRENHSIFAFCNSLKVILNTTEKMQILTVLHSMVPEELLEDFDSLCCIHFDYYKNVLKPKIQEDLKKPKSAKEFADKKKPVRHGSVLAKGTIEAGIGQNTNRRRTRSMEGNLDNIPLEVSTKRIPGQKDKKREERERKERKRSKTAHVELLRVMSMTDETHARFTNSQGSSGSSQNVKFRKVKLEKRPGESLGFCIRGGKDLHAGIYISSIDSGGQAENKGLKVGERILKVNETSLKNVTHAEAVVAIKSATKLTLYLAQSGQMPGTPSDTPRSHESSESSAKRQSSLGDDMRVVLLVADDDGFLGCSIRGGVDYGLPVTVASIDPLSPAHKAGLKRGELVLKVNGEDISRMSHLEVVNLMTTSNVVKMLVMPNMNRVKRRSSSQSVDLLKSQRLQHDSNQAKSSTLRTRSSSRSPRLPSTPIRIRRRPADMSAFEQELRATPPRSTSTPLPSDGQVNRNEPLNESLFTNNHSISTSHHEPIPKINFQSSDYGNTSSGSSVENVAPQKDVKMKGFENGTIRMNMNRKDKLNLNNAKLVDINIDTTKDGNRREPVKSIFPSCAQNNADKNNNSDDEMDCDGFDVNRNQSPKPTNNGLYEHMNILSTPSGSNFPHNPLHVSGKVSPLLLPLQNIGVSSSGGDQTPSNAQTSKKKKKSRLSLAAKIFSKKRTRGSISSGTSAYSSTESLDAMVEGRQLPSVDDNNSTTADWIMY